MAARREVARAGFARQTHAMANPRDDATADPRDDTPGPAIHGPCEPPATGPEVHIVDCESIIRALGRRPARLVGRRQGASACRALR